MMHTSNKSTARRWQSMHARGARGWHNMLLLFDHDITSQAATSAAVLIRSAAAHEPHYSGCGCVRRLLAALLAFARSRCLGRRLAGCWRAAGRAALTRPARSGGRGGARVASATRQPGSDWLTLGWLGAHWLLAAGGWALGDFCLAANFFPPEVTEKKNGQQKRATVNRGNIQFQQ